MILFPGTNNGAMLKAYLNMTGAVIDSKTGFPSVTKAQYLKLQSFKIVIENYVGVSSSCTVLT